MKETTLTTFAEFKVNLTKLTKEKSFDFDVFEFTENVIATQRSIHEKELKVLEYFEKEFSVNDFKNRVIERVKGVKMEQKEYFKSGKTCPGCHSDHVTKKGQRVLKKGKIQRYQCQACAKVFSEDIS